MMEWNQGNPSYPPCIISGCRSPFLWAFYCIRLSQFHQKRPQIVAGVAVAKLILGVLEGA